MSDEPGPGGGGGGGGPDTATARNTDMPSSETTPLLPRDSNGTATTTTTTRNKLNEVHHGMGPLRIAAVAFTLWILVFVQASNMSGITMIQGSIAKDLDAYGQTMWFTSGYLITMSSLAPLFGKFAAVFSPRILVLPVGVFVASGSAVSATAVSFAQFVLGRVVMGMGGAGVLTLAIILVLDLSDKKSRGLILGLVNAGFSIGVSLGGVVYGALLPAIGWRALFWVQCPMSIASALALFFSLPAGLTSAPQLGKSPDSQSLSTWQKIRRIDYIGAALMVTTICTFLIGFSRTTSPIFLITSLISLVAFVAFEILVASDPIIPLLVLRSRAVLLSCISQLGLMSARWTLLYYVPIFIQAVRGDPPARAGALLIPTNVSFALGGTIVGALHIRRAGSFWLPALVSIAIFALSMWVASSLARPDVAIGPLVLAVMAGGFATGAAINYTLTHLLHHSHHGVEYITTSLLSTFRGFGGAFGTSLGGGVFARILESSLVDGFHALEGSGPDDPLTPAHRSLVSKLMGAPELVHNGGLSADDSQVAIDAYAGATRGVWQAAAGLGLIVLFLQAGTGWRGPAEKEREAAEDEAMAEDEERAAAENQTDGQA